MWLPGPVFYKELVTLARRRRHFAVRALFLASITFSLYFFGRAKMAVWAQGNAFLDFAQAIGRPLFNVFAVAQFAVIVLVVPAVVAAVVAVEKERDTLGLLLITRQSLSRILVDKVLSRLAYAGFLLLAGAPLMLALLAFGGVEPEEVVNVYLVLIGTVLYCAAFGLLCSVWMHAMHSALIVTFLILPLATGLLFGLAVVMIETQPDGPGNVLACALPLYALLVTIGERGANAELSLWAGPLALFGGVLLLGCSLSLSIALLPRRLTRRPRSLVRRVFGYLNDMFRSGGGLLGTELWRDTPLGRYPVLWRETSKQFFSSNTFLVRSGYLLLIVCTPLALVLGFSPEGMLGALMLGWFAFVWVAAVILSSRTFTYEKERHTLEVLLSTPLNARAVYWGKFLGVFKSLGAVIVVPIVLLWVASAVGSPHDWRSVPLLSGLFLAFLGHVVVTGLNCSARRRQGLTALFQTLLLGACQLGGFSVALAMMLWWGQGTPGELFGRYPDVVSMRAVGDMMFLETVSLPDRLWGMMERGARDPATVLVVGAGALLLVLLLLWRLRTASRGFDRAVGRM